MGGTRQTHNETPGLSPRAPTTGIHRPRTREHPHLNDLALLVYATTVGARCVRPELGDRATGDLELVPTEILPAELDEDSLPRGVISINRSLRVDIRRLTSGVQQIRERHEQFSSQRIAYEAKFPHGVPETDRHYQGLINLEALHREQLVAWEANQTHAGSVIAKSKAEEYQYRLKEPEIRADLNGRLMAGETWQQIIGDIWSRHSYHKIEIEIEPGAKARGLIETLAYEEFEKYRRDPLGREDKFLDDLDLSGKNALKILPARYGQTIHKAVEDRLRSEVFSRLCLWIGDLNFVQQAGGDYPGRPDILALREPAIPSHLWPPAELLERFVELTTDRCAQGHEARVDGVPIKVETAGYPDFRWVAAARHMAERNKNAGISNASTSNTSLSNTGLSGQGLAI